MLAKTILLGGTNDNREQRANKKGASIKTEHHIEVDGLMYRWAKPGGNKIKDMTQTPKGKLKRN